MIWNLLVGLGRGGRGKSSLDIDPIDWTVPISVELNSHYGIFHSKPSFCDINKSANQPTNRPTNLHHHHLVIILCAKGENS
jgi:hypothetical protein